MKKKKSILNYSPPMLPREEQDLRTAHEMRAYKYKRDTALAKKSIRSHTGFSKALDSFISNSRKLRDLRANGHAEEKFELDYGKVAYTIGLFLTNITQVILCIILGVWPLSILIGLAIVSLNIYWLLKDN